MRVTNRNLTATVLILIWVLAGCAGSGHDHADRTSPAANISTSHASGTKAPPADPDALPPNILKWNSEHVVYHASSTAEPAEIDFSVTNISPAEVVIQDVGTSCGCTAADLPETPWKLAPGKGGKLHVTIDLSDKEGTNTSEIVVFTSKGNQSLSITTIVPE